MNQYIQIDEEGYFVSEGLRVTDEGYGRELFENLKQEEGCFKSQAGGSPVIVEAFDEPFVALQVFSGDVWEIQMPYGYREKLIFESLCADPWDRFHGRTENGISFVLSRAAQAELFNMVDDFDDDSLVVNGKRYPVPEWLSFSEEDEIDQGDYWTRRYQEGRTGWELGEPASPLKYWIPKLKLPKSRIIALGAGSGHDAALLAQTGHLVTAVDFSSEAVERANKEYGHLENLKIVSKDIFNLPPEWNQSFDLVLEHTCFCAVNPRRREELVGLWKRLLAPGGHILGIFFAMDKRVGPPFGSSEWEIRERLKKDFRFLYWRRWRQSIQSRLGIEFVVYAQKRH